MSRFPSLTNLGAGRGRTAAVALVLVLAGCSSESSSHAKPPGPKPPNHLVELAPVSRELLQYTADREGTLRALREVKVYNQEEGSVLEVRVREGDAVAKDQVLARLDDRLLRAELDKAIATLRQAEVDLERLERLYGRRLVAEEAVTRAQTNLEVARASERVLRTRVSYMTITAPFAGRVAARLVEPGDVAPKHTHLLTVVDPSVLVTDVQVSELVLPRLRRGDRAGVRIDALGLDVYRGEVLRIYPTVDPVTRRGRIEVALKPVPPGARPGQFCRVTLYAAGREHLVIPYAALRRDAKGEHVFLYEPANGAPGGHVKRVDVRSGLRLAERVEIREGLAPGQKVVARGFIGLSDGQKVQPVSSEPGTPSSEPGTPAPAEAKAADA